MIPETAPALVISHDDVSIATVEVLLPKVVAPVEDREVNAPAAAVVCPMVVPLIVPPVAVSVPAVIAFVALLKVKAFEYVPESPADCNIPDPFNI